MHNDVASQLRDGVLDLLHHTLARFPPAHAPVPPGDAAPPYRVGEYLVHLGYLMPRQLDGALYVAQHTHTRIGSALIAQARVPVEALTAALLMQLCDRAAADVEHAPRFLGEQLVVEARLRPDQLALVLQEQLAASQHGTWVRLGDLIVRHGWLDTATVNQAAARREHAPC